MTIPYPNVTIDAKRFCQLGNVRGRRCIDLPKEMENKSMDRGAGGGTGPLNNFPKNALKSLSLTTNVSKEKNIM